MAIPVSPVNVEGVGRVMVTLDDVRLILYVAIVVIVVLGGLLIWSLRSARVERETIAKAAALVRAVEVQAILDERTAMASERDRMWTVSDKFGAAADRVGETMDKLSLEIKFLSATSSRVEARNDGPR